MVLAIEDVADDETLTAIEQALERFGGTGNARLCRDSSRTKRALSRRAGPPFVCTRHVSALTNCGVAAFVVPAAVLRRFATPAYGSLAPTIFGSDG